MKKLSLTIFAAFLNLIVIGQSGHKYLDPSIEVDDRNVPFNKDQFYFPVELFPEIDMVYESTGTNKYTVTLKVIENSIDTFYLKWYSEFLYAMNEPLLFNQQFSMTVFRFTWLRTFHQPVVIRIEKSNESYSVGWKITNGQGGYEPGEIITSEQRTIEKEHWNQFIELTDEFAFWNLERSGSLGTDGSEWILEGVTPTQYHVTSSWSPGKQSDIYKLCNYLIELTELSIKESDKY